MVESGRCVYCMAPVETDKIKFCVKCWQFLVTSGQWETLARQHQIGRFAPNFKLGKVTEPGPYEEVTG